MNTAYIKVTRKTSEYNKYMKWNVTYHREDMSLISSEWFKTKKTAVQNMENSICRGKRGFPIGDRISYTNYIIL